MCPKALKTLKLSVFAFLSTPGSVFMKMVKASPLVRTIATAAVSGWYGFVFGREHACKEIGSWIEDLRFQNPRSDPPPPRS